MEPVYVPRSPQEKAMQRALMQYFLPSNFNTVRKALRQVHREDLIGFGKNALVPPERERPVRETVQKTGKTPAKKGKPAKKTVDKRRRNG